MKGVLFLCVANSARSQMAEGIARALLPPDVKVWSAGSRPTHVRPEAIAVLSEIGIDISQHRAKAVAEIPGAEVDTVVTLCGEEECPLFLGKAVRLHWGLADPAAVSGTELDRLVAFRRVRDELRTRIATKPTAERVEEGRSVMTAPGRRLWLVAAIVALAVTGAWFSVHRRSAAAAQAVELTNGRAKLFDFGMGVCEQCKKMKPVMEQAARELSDRLEVHVLDIRDEANERLARRYQMTVIPLVVLADGAGNELWRHEGFIDFQELSRAVIARLGPTTATQTGRSGR